MIERIRFHGLPLEDLVLHLRKFLKLTNTVKSPANALDYIKLAAFPFSLGGKAKDWPRDLPSRSITTWDSMLTSILEEILSCRKV